MSTIDLPGGVLFDLDGTIMDSAPDIAAAVNRVSVQLGLGLRNEEKIRAAVSKGGAAIVAAAFGELDEAMREPILQRSLAEYALRIFEKSKYFAGIEELLEALDQAKVHWGIVTNKNSHLTSLLAAATGLNKRASVIVCGDTLEQRKPDPAPVLHACKVAGIDPLNSFFVGDDLRDVQAGRAAGLKTIGVTYGYADADEVASWNADFVVSHAIEILPLVGLR